MKESKELRHLRLVMEDSHRVAKMMKHTAGEGISEEVYKQAKRDYELAVAEHKGAGSTEVGKMGRGMNHQKSKIEHGVEVNGKWVGHTTQTCPMCQDGMAWDEDIEQHIPRDDYDLSTGRESRRT